MLPDDPKERKTYPIATGLLDYFPRALAAVAHLSYVGNNQHSPGKPLHWDRSKSTDEDDALMRHFLRRNEVDSDGVPERVKVAWRALAGLEKWLEAQEEKKKPIFTEQEKERIRNAYAGNLGEVLKPTPRDIYGRPLHPQHPAVIYLGDSTLEHGAIMPVPPPGKMIYATIPGALPTEAHCIHKRTIDDAWDHCGICYPEKK